ncbi:hypothetical protein LOC68_02150 [Blastopirellula sp. JC732]|uniref:Uncharacterized protein n=1 Tax=Blastopirellula sediminis TaxID=2894196 RepID=A0A9X1MKK5_9BACT|nr:hypothetical protein [Blastopirellula sediminis]MCC9608008.1 hypothetical protein [Blastopirellula sediminis]MCC9627199.1 hypothetical protein [Blastopirellula sediminis]
MMIWVGLSVAFDCQGAEPGESETAAKELQLKTPTIPNHLEGAVRDLNAQFSEGIDPDKNAVVYLVRLLGDDIFDAGLRDDSLAMLGIESIGNGSPRFAYFEQYVTSVVPKDASKRQDLLKQLTLEFQSANGAVWKSADYPALAQYFAANEAALDELVRISKFPSYYAPILTAENPPTLLGASYAIERRIPYLGQCLSIRASQRMGDGNFAGAVSDLIAVHQLANQLAEGSPLDVSLAKAHWVDSYAFQAEYAILASGMLTADQAKEYQKELQNVSSMAPSQTAADIGERLILRQEIESLKEHDAAFYAFFDWAPASHAEQMKALRAANIDWDLALQRANEVQDETVETLLISDAKRQAEEIDRLNSEVDEWRKRNDADETTLLEALEVDRDQGSRWIGEAVALALRTNIWQRLCTDRRGHVRRDFISVGLALEEYHRRRGYYPAALADLSPEILPSIPNDSHSQKPFTYMRNDDQHVELISWGTNRENDAGRLLQDDLILKLGR